VNADEVAAVAAAAFVDAAAQAMAKTGRFLCAVPGGSVAERMLPRLADAGLDWRRTEVWLADERRVAVDDAESNQRAVRESWLDRVPASHRPRLHGLHLPGASTADAVQAATEDLIDIAGTPPRLDLVVLGVGPDGHVASLFPSHDAWRRSKAWVIAVDDAPKPPPERLSLGLPTLASAHAVWLVAFGTPKAGVVAEARTSPVSTLPAAVVARSGPAVRWFLDDGASGISAGRESR
jgi:6-phosphogluconolactonase